MKQLTIPISLCLLAVGTNEMHSAQLSIDNNKQIYMVQNPDNGYVLFGIHILVMKDGYLPFKDGKLKLNIYRRYDNGSFASQGTVDVVRNATYRDNSLVWEYFDSYSPVWDKLVIGNDNPGALELYLEDVFHYPSSLSSRNVKYRFELVDDNGNIFASNETNMLDFNSWGTVTGLDEVGANQSVVAERIFSLDGKPLRTKPTGTPFVVVRQYADGRSETRKVLR